MLFLDPAAQERWADWDAFALLWDSHEIDVHDHKEKTIRHEDHGEIRLDFEFLTSMDTPNQFLVLHRTRTGDRGQP
jgi:MmyB-like transcription regulator ligand binding domain